MKITRYISFVFQYCISSSLYYAVHCIRYAIDITPHCRCRLILLRHYSFLITISILASMNISDIVFLFAIFISFVFISFLRYFLSLFIFIIIFVITFHFQYFLSSSILFHFLLRFQSFSFFHYWDIDMITIISLILTFHYIIE